MMYKFDTCQLFSPRQNKWGQLSRLQQAQVWCTAIRCPSPKQVVLRHHLESPGHSSLFVSQPWIKVHTTNTVQVLYRELWVCHLFTLIDYERNFLLRRRNPAMLVLQAHSRVTWGRAPIGVNAHRVLLKCGVSPWPNNKGIFNNIHVFPPDKLDFGPEAHFMLTRVFLIMGIS